MKVMKKLLGLLFGLLVLAGCSDQLTDNDLLRVETTANQVTDEYHYYLEKARWGDAEAYVKLADCYRNGVGVKMDFMGMVGLLSMAEKYDSSKKLNNYFNALPDDDCYKMLFFTIERLNKKDIEEVAQLSNTLIAKGIPEGYVLNGAIQVEHGDTIGGLETIRMGADLGSSFGELILGMSPSLLTNNKKPFDANILLKMADKYPYANKFLAEMYAGEVCDSVLDVELATKYFLKADEYGFLGQKGAKWLLNYYEEKGIQIDEREKQRLNILAKGYNGETEIEESGQEEVSSFETSYNKYLDSLASVYMKDDKCDKAIIYVVETETGRLVGQSSLEIRGDQYVPFTDTFNRENEYIHGVATYLAVQWTGNVSSITMIDTGCGVYEDKNGKMVKDHNWRRGGYGKISLEDALTHRSEVGFTKAIELAYGNDRKRYEDQISFYLNEQPDNLIGMLTFYNAIANGGKMVKICGAQETDVTILHDQICYPEYVEPVQRAMERCVSDGIYKKAGNEYTDVAACGRTLRIDDTRYRLELCGYFPTKNPKFTIMVVMEKDGLPASAGSMCGPLFSQIVVSLLCYV